MSEDYREQAVEIHSLTQDSMVELHRSFPDTVVCLLTCAEDERYTYVTNASSEERMRTLAQALRSLASSIEKDADAKERRRGMN